MDIGSFAFCAFFSWKSWTLLHEAIHEGQTTSSSFGPPLWIPYGLMAVGMTLLSLQMLAPDPDTLHQEKGDHMSVGTIGSLYGVVTLLVMFSGMPIAFSLGVVATDLHVFLHARFGSRYGDTERF